MNIREAYALYGGNRAVGSVKLPPPTLSIRAQQALEAHDPVTQQKHRTSVYYERRLAKITGGMSQGFRHPFDVIVKGRVGVVVKTITAQLYNKVTMTSELAAVKKADALKLGLEKTCTVVFDTRPNETVIYYRSGVGAFKLGAMQRLKSLDDLRKAVLS